MYNHRDQILKEGKVGIERLNSRDPISYLMVFHESYDSCCGAGNAPTSSD